MKSSSLPNSRQRTIVAYVLFVMLFVAGVRASAQDTTTKPPATPPDQSTTQPPPVAAGGPQGDTGTIAIPKKPKDDKPEVPARKPQLKNPEGIGDYSLRVSVPIVNVDVSVLTKDGQFIPGLKPENFHIYEDGVLQQVTHFEQSEAPITMVMLLEFSRCLYANVGGRCISSYNFNVDMLNSAYTYAQTLKKEDYVAVISYDIKPHIEVDFTQDKREVAQALNSMRMPTWSEANLFDALYDTIDRIDGIEGRKYILLVGSGLDTFSKITWDKCMAKVKSSHNITMFTISTGEVAKILMEGPGGMGTMNEMAFLQADNQMKTLATMTGGQHFAPRFVGELPADFQAINAAIRNQYTLTYHPVNNKQDGTWRKLKVDVVAADGGPLTIKDQNNKTLKYMVLSRDGYKAKQVVE